MFLLIAVEHMQPALAAVDADALAALGSRVAFDLIDQRQRLTAMRERLLASTMSPADPAVWSTLLRFSREDQSRCIR
jgi:hypothetical protein